MKNRGYSESPEPDQTGSSGPDAEALGTAGPGGRTGSTLSSKIAQASGSDASTDHFQLTYYDPPAGLERYVLTLFHFVWDEEVIEDRHPGGLGQLFLTPCGKGEIRFGERTDPFEGPAHMFSGFETAARFRVEGPWHSIGASLTPLGWAALTRVPASDVVDRLLPAGDLLGETIGAFAEDVAARYRANELLGAEACEALGEWIATNLHPVSNAHAVLIDRTFAWLGTSLHPDVEPLFESLDYSRRQAERLVIRYFGFAPAALARRYRAIRAANLLSQPGLTDEGEAEIAAAFYDQPHMIREIRRYCGYTPTRLGGAGEPLFQTMLRLRNLERLKHYRQIGTSE
ncbi:MAG: helix-turn-helix domain-containing protein [Erythrobacter sp.]